MKNVIILLFYSSFFLTISCKKFMDIDPPVNSIVTEQVFADSINAGSALQGIYTLLDQQTADFGNGRITSFCGEYADELIPFFKTNSNDAYYYNQINAGNVFAPAMWNTPYQIIYQLNSIIENIEKSPGISVTAKTDFVAEAKFLRAFIYFYLVNLYGDVPYVKSTVWSETAKTPRTNIQTVYQYIINDIIYAQSSLREDYNSGGGQKIRPNKWVATAFLARCYLYQQNWKKAEIESAKLIEQGLFKLNANLNDVFEKNNSEAILQWNRNTNFSPFNATPEGVLFSLNGTRPSFYLTDWLLSDFESGDQRKENWTKNTNYLGKTYVYPYKYKIGNDFTSGAPSTEYYTVFRLAEQYLIRAEARAQQNKLLLAINDINEIRNRAGLDDLSDNLTQSQILLAIEHERRIEFFAEWGHRWLDLKRTGRADAVMSIATPLKSGQPWQAYKKLMPIPKTEITNGPFITQNPGYTN